MQRKILVALDATSVSLSGGREGALRCCFKTKTAKANRKASNTHLGKFLACFMSALFTLSVAGMPKENLNLGREGIIRRKRGAVLSSRNTHLSSVNLSYRVLDRRLSLFTFPLQLFYSRQGRTIRVPGAKVWASLMAQAVKDLPVTQETQETQVRSLGREDALEKETATHSSILAWRIPWTEEPDGLQSMGSQRVRHG